MSALGLGLAWCLGLTTAVPTATVATSSIALPAEAGLDLSSELRPEPEPGLALGYTALELPQNFLELTFTPLYPVLYALERWDLIPRAIELFTNRDGTMALVPLVEPFSSSGPGFGAAFVQNDPLGSADRLVLLTLVRTNRDRQVSASFRRRIPTLQGRQLGISASYDIDHDARYFGIGAQTQPEDERLLRIDAYNVESNFNIIDPARWPEWTGTARLAYRRRSLSRGEGTTAPPLRPSGRIPVPAGFDQDLDYPEFGFELGYDSRNSFGRTTRGIVGSLDALITHDVSGGSTGAIRTTASVAAFVPVLPRFRVLFLQAGLGATVPIGKGAEAPLHTLIGLGGSKTLRGYDPDRWRDRIGWWATAEYRYHFWDYVDSGVSLHGALFADLGAVADRPGVLLEGPLPWSVGFALRIEQTLLMIGRIQFAYSPEGFRLSFAVGDLP